MIKYSQVDIMNGHHGLDGQPDCTMARFFILGGGGVQGQGKGCG